MNKKTISIITPCFNEEENILPIFEAIKKEFDNLDYEYEHIFIDNDSDDETVKLIKELTVTYTYVKLIKNTRNFGPISSPVHGLIQSSGDASIMLACDFEDPPTLIPQLIREWEKGFKIVLAVKKVSHEKFLFKYLKKAYYKFMSLITESTHIENATGYGLYDKKVIGIIKQIDDKSPYLRGILGRIGYKISTVPFTRNNRTRGKSKHNFFSLFKFAMLGVSSESDFPIHLITLFGFIASVIGFILSLLYLVVKILYWDSFAAGIAPLILIVLFFGSLQVFTIGIIGQYVRSILRKIDKMPLVIEEERINFDDKRDESDR
tara:strand:+ start:7597 stop:8556 length:960 start_codon:yes stop_codon:yes gene_type:complete